MIETLFLNPFFWFICAAIWVAGQLIFYYYQKKVKYREFLETEYKRVTVTAFDEMIIKSRLHNSEYVYHVTSKNGHRVIDRTLPINNPVIKVSAVDLALPAITDLQQELLRLRNMAGRTEPLKEMCAINCAGCGAQVRTGKVACEYCGKERNKQK